MARLPVPGSDDGTWGDLLNVFLSVEHNADGTLKTSGSLSAKADTTTTITGTSSVSGGGNLAANRTLSLVNDSATPGASKYYGTDNSGTKGYFSLPNASSSKALAFAIIFGGF